MNINVSNNLQGVQGWDQLSSLLKAGAAAGTEGTVSIKNDGIEITVSDAKAGKRAVMVSVPDLGAIKGTPDTEALKSVADKIVAIANELSSSATLSGDAEVVKALEGAVANLKASAAAEAAGGAAKTMNTTNTSKVLFDLFALMALMVEVAQKQRDTAREVRLTENQQVQNSIKSQADNIRNAAIISLGFGIASALVSGVMSGVALGMQAKAFTQQSSAVKALDTPSQNLKMAQLATDKQAATANFEAVSAKTSQAIKTEVNQKFAAEQADFATDMQAADTRIQQANAAQDTAGAELVAVKAKADPPASPAEIDLATRNYDKASADVAAAKANRTSREQAFFDKVGTEIKSNDAAIATKQGQIEAKQVELKTAKGDAAVNLKNEIATLKGEVATLEQKGTYLRAYNAKQKADFASDSTKNSDLAIAQNKYDFAKRDMELGAEYAGSQQTMNRWMSIQQLSMSLAQMTNASGNMVGEMVRANATMEGVEQSMHNEQLDQIKDLFSQAETLVHAVVQLMQAVLSAENESLMEAIRA